MGTKMKSYEVFEVLGVLAFLLGGCMFDSASLLFPSVVMILGLTFAGSGLILEKIAAMHRKQQHEKMRVLKTRNIDFSVGSNAS